MTNRNSLKPSCECSIDRLLQHEDIFIFITEAQKQSDSFSGKSYITYHLRIGDTETKRRYSEFESFRKALTSLYPALIIPPIPEKHSFVDYATLQAKIKDDLPMIEKRKRMLQTFLNRVAKHPELGKDHVFHQFLESTVTWSDVLHSPPLSTIPKNPLQMVLHRDVQMPTHTFNPVLASNLIPTPSAAYQLKKPDPRFEESEKFTFRIANHMSNNLDKSQRKVIRRLGGSHEKNERIRGLMFMIELANDYAELGAVYNGFSLNESGTVANAIEKIGQAVDTGYTETGQMVTSLEGEFAEPIQEHAQFAHIIKKTLKFRHMKHVQVELIEEELENKKEHLNSLQNMENEARRLEEALTRNKTIGPNAVDVDEINNPQEELIGASRVLSSRSSNSTWSGRSMRVISAVGYTLQNIIDVDPEATRRNQIGMSKDAIHVLEEALNITNKDLNSVSTELQADLDRFQREKIHDMRDMMIAYAKIHIRYCQKNLKSWQEARAEVEKVEI